MTREGRATASGSSCCPRPDGREARDGDVGESAAFGCKQQIDFLPFLKLREACQFRVHADGYAAIVNHFEVTPRHDF